jgi:hypothetical protein
VSVFVGIEADWEKKSERKRNGFESFG